MPTPIESFRSARQRINPEGLAFSGAAALASPAVMLPVQAGLTYAIHEISKETDPTLLKFIAIGILGIANAVSIAAETKALNVDNYSAGPISSTVNILTGKSYLSSLVGHVANYVQLSIVNPINAAALITGNNQLLMESEAATALTFTGWSISMNALILTGRTRPVI